MSSTDRRVHCPNCGWGGPNVLLVRRSSTTWADEWWECPECGRDASSMNWVPEGVACVEGESCL